MKKVTMVGLLGILFFMTALPLSRAADSDDAGTAPEGTPQEMASMEKTLLSEKLDDIEQGMSEMQESINALTERVQDLERTVFDDNGRT